MQQLRSSAFQGKASEGTFKHADIGKAGHPPVLSPNKEQEIVEICKIFSDWGFGLTKVDIIKL